MTKTKFIFILCLIGIALVSCSNVKNKGITKKNTNDLEIPDSLKINDGPYVFIKNEVLIEKSIVSGKVTKKFMPLTAYDIKFKAEASVYKDVEHIVALSDIHGQFDLAIEILKNNKVIDNNLNWSFGKGHFVIVGDVFDRGPKVTETLWFIYNLEKQAEKSGGKVHFLLGNHEYMVIHNDLRYIHDKYAKASQLLKTPYNELFNNETVLGRWLRSKATLIKINDNMFVHGGVSPDFLSETFNIDNTNQVMRESLDRDKKEMKAGPFYKRYYGKTGPIWYRGYFNDNLEESVIDDVLAKVDANHFVVGHCSQEQVLQLYNKKIFAVDSSIKNGVYGEVLFINLNAYSRGKKTGEQIKLD
ncbi:metallophosphoesterase [Ichthyenterobacterium magnum]|uniref:Calcineurin-like phosphoesterase family protein n=1 Tax=Ichthyenterobacterium magnum TaxID=1230530 RepID=A0A420DL93_9FLAO|nr:metallophosphoesterase [Ichthyenterobacterium magnum]RKE94961.1 calcineurin-like phosphoesterase family protein [Ichthyenterobacterium magnum]